MNKFFAKMLFSDGDSHIRNIDGASGASTQPHTNPFPEVIMVICEKCGQEVQDKDVQMIRKKTVCEECYFDEIMPKMPKAYYNNDAEFMNRLKESYSVRKQQYH